MIKRIITGSLLATLCLASFFIGGLVLFFVVLFAAILCALELAMMLKERGYKPNLYLIIGGIFAIFSTVFLKNSIQIYQTLPVKIVILGFLSLFLIELFLKKPFFPQNSWIISLRVLLFFSFTFLFIILVRYTNDGLSKLLFVSFLVWITDSFALFGGKLFGKHPLSPISPKKTIEGSVSAILACIVFALGVAWFFKLHLLGCTISAIAISIIAQIGDLHESLIKRFLNSKDSSQLLPGHGGIYDRLDSSLFVAPLIFYFLVF